ncbi:MAG: hypothetical protein ACLFV8_01440 [Alphaproteobacteria bacterium]
MARQAKRRRKSRIKGRGGRFPFPVPEPEAAEYTFALIRSLLAITREHNSLQLTTYFLEMAALEIAPRLAEEALEAENHESSRATS